MNKIEVLVPVAAAIEVSTNNTILTFLTLGSLKKFQQQIKLTPVGIEPTTLTITGIEV